MRALQAIAIILILEGGEVNDKVDKGGHTKYGITKVRYPDEDIGALTIERATVLYKRDFWNKFKIESFPVSLRLWVMDLYVNHSPKGAALIVQRAIVDKAASVGVKNISEVDGIIGRKTMTALRIHTPEQSRLAAWRLKYYCSIVDNDRRQSKFLYGWTMRIHKLLHLDDAFKRSVTVSV